jgi:hypothetical protein
MRPADWRYIVVRRGPQRGATPTVASLVGCFARQYDTGYPTPAAPLGDAGQCYPLRAPRAEGFAASRLE